MFLLLSLLIDQFNIFQAYPTQSTKIPTPVSSLPSTLPSQTHCQSEAAQARPSPSKTHSLSSTSTTPTSTQASATTAAANATFSSPNALRPATQCRATLVHYPPTGSSRSTSSISRTLTKASTRSSRPFLSPSKSQRRTSMPLRSCTSTTMTPPSCPQMASISPVSASPVNRKRCLPSNTCTH